MSREEFIGKLQMVYVGDRNAFNDIVCAYDSLLCKNEKVVEILENIYMLDNVTITNNACVEIDKAINILQNGSEDNE